VYAILAEECLESVSRAVEGADEVITAAIDDVLVDELSLPIFTNHFVYLLQGGFAVAVDDERAF
jgi:hypothetical protein